MQTLRFTFLNRESLYFGAVNSSVDKAFFAVIVFDDANGGQNVISSTLVSISIAAMKRIVEYGFNLCNLDEHPRLRGVVIEHFRREDERFRLAFKGWEPDFYNNGAGVRTLKELAVTPSGEYLVQ